MINKDEKLKPMLKVNELINHMKMKKIKFELIDEKTAEKYLRENNNYFNLSSYKKIYDRYVGGENDQKFIDLDFACLKDLAIIDMRIRYLLFQMTTDIEHYLKIEILNLIETIEGEDGYIVVNEYLEDDFKKEKRLHKSIFNKIGDIKYKELFKKYKLKQNEQIKNVPIWEFLEIISFGDLVSFYIFFSKKYNLSRQFKRRFILIEINKLRNAAAHNSCILCDIKEKDNLNNCDLRILSLLGQCGITEDTRTIKLSNTRIRQITYTLFMFNDIVTSEGIKQYITSELNNLFYGRIIYHKEYYNNNELLLSTFNYFDKIISYYYKIDNNEL